MEEEIANTGEYYKWDFNALVKELGTDKAMQKVAMYQQPLYCNIPCVKNGRLLQTFQGFAPESFDRQTVSIIPPLLTEAEFKDNSDKGLTNLPSLDKYVLWQRKQQEARRAKRYV